MLDAAYEGVLRDGFRALTVEAVSAETGIAKTSIYRRWPNKAAVVMNAFSFRIGPHISFPKQQDPLESIRRQMLSLARAFRGPAGTMIKALLAEAQFDQELAKAFLQRWLLPRRRSTSGRDTVRSVTSGPLYPGDYRYSVWRFVLPPYDRLRSDFSSLRRNLGLLYVTRPILKHYTLSRNELLQRAMSVFDAIASGTLKLRIEHVYQLNQADQGAS